MNGALKEAALSMTALMAMTTEDEIIKSPARFYGMVCDFLSEPRFGEAKKLIKKGLDSGAYTEILSKNSNREGEAQKAVLKLVDVEFMTEGHAREIVGLFLIALDPDPEHLLSVEAWVDECAESHQAVSNVMPQPTVEEVKEAAKLQTNNEIEPLLKRMFIFLEDKAWSSATQYAERILDKDPECSKAYLGKLMAELKVSKEILLGEASTPQIAIKENFKRACKYATAEELKVLKDYEYRNAYAHGKEVMGRAKTEKNFKDASAWFALYPSYKDSKKLYDECIEKAEIARKEALYREALNLPLEKQATAFSAISGYKDADSKRQQAIAKVEQQKSQERWRREQEHLRVQKDVQEGTRLTTLGVIIIIAALVIDLSLTLILKDISSMCRWLWLPLISLGLSVIVAPILSSFCDNVYVGDWILPFWTIGSSIWAVIRGIIVVVAYFKASSGWAVFGAIFLCLFMFIFNSFSYFVSAGICSKNN